VDRNSELNETSRSGSAEFLKDARWKEVFIPTITHALYVSREPFLHWASESPQFLVTVQRVFDVSFPNVQYVLSSNDAVTQTVRLFPHAYWAFLNINFI